MKKTKVVLMTFAVFAAMLMLMTTSMARSEIKEVESERPDFIGITVDPDGDYVIDLDDIIDDLIDGLEDWLEENGFDGSYDIYQDPSYEPPTTLIPVDGPVRVEP